MPDEYGFNKVKKSSLKSAYCSICDDYGLNADDVNEWDWFYSTDYGNFGNVGKATQRPPPDNFTR